MKKWLALFLLALLLLPVAGFADLEYQRETRTYINFPALDGLRAAFTNMPSFVIVTPENMEEHMELLLARGDTEEEIRARFAREEMVFEAYSPDLPADACYRVEQYENEITRNVWHARHLNQTAREELTYQINMGFLMDDYYVFNLQGSRSSDMSCLSGNYTSYPPARLEAGRVQLHFRNGKLYVFMYCHLDRLLMRSGGGKADNLYAALFTEYTRFNSELLPQLTPFKLDKEFPGIAVPGDVTITGTMREGAKLSVLLDGEAVNCTVDSKGKFSTTLHLTEDGDHEVRFIATHPRNTTREEAFTINVSSNRTHLHLATAPYGYVLAGKVKVEGTTDPTADLVLQMDDEPPIVLDLDTNGAFSQEFVIRDTTLHELHIHAEAPDKDPIIATLPFITIYESAYEGLNAYMKKLNTTALATIVQDPDSYVGEHIKVRVQVKKLLFTDTGLGLLCEVFTGSQAKNNSPRLYVTVYGYGDMMINEGNIITVYGEILGTQIVEGEETPRLNIHLQYGAFERW